MMDKAPLSTREKIMQMLKTDGELSAKAMSERLGITLMAVRRHLNTLERDHLIESGTVRQPMGRPMSVYRLTPGADDYFPKKYHAVALELLAELAQDSGEPGEPPVRSPAALLYDQYESRLRGKKLADKVALLSDIQNESGYMAEWDKISESEFVLTEYNCPIARIANQYNHACACELGLFADLLGAEVERTSCLASGDRKCVYKIKGAEGGIRSARGNIMNNMGFVIVEVCANNGINSDALEAFEAENPDIAVLRMECLSLCGLCARQPYALVNGKRVTARSVNECLDRVKEKITAELDEYAEEDWYDE